MTDVLPVKNGDWVARVGDPGCVATVRAVYILNGKVLVDLYLYGGTGRRVGRESPALDGPKNYEPSCDYEGYWQRISRPEFPIALRWMPAENGRSIAQYHHGGNVLPNRQWVPKLPKARVAVINFDPELEVRSRMMAAQELRDLAKRLGVPDLIVQAERLEQEAKAFRA